MSDIDFSLNLVQKLGLVRDSFGAIATLEGSIGRQFGNPSVILVAGQ